MYMNNRMLYLSLTAAVAGWSCVFYATQLTAQEREPVPRNEPGERPQRPRPAIGQGEGERPQNPNGDPNRQRPLGAFRIGGRVLIVWPQAEAQPQRELEEDLNTMMHLVERTVEKTFAVNMDDENGPRRFMPPLNINESQALFLDDYGAVFSFRTFLPLQGNTQANTPPNGNQPGNRWDKARQELFGNGQDGNREMRPVALQYDAVKVGILKDQLLQLLKDASHLRHLKPEHQIALVLSGPSPMPSQPPEVKPNVSPEERRSVIERFRNQLNLSTSLVLRVKKADIDTFATGKLTAEQFRDKVSIVNN